MILAITKIRKHGNGKKVGMEWKPENKAKNSENVGKEIFSTEKTLV
jgi:hypothetical protein